MGHRSNEIDRENEYSIKYILEMYINKMEKKNDEKNFQRVCSRFLSTNLQNVYMYSCVYVYGMDIWAILKVYR